MSKTSWSKAKRYTLKKRQAECGGYRNKRGCLSCLSPKKSVLAARFFRHQSAASDGLYHKTRSGK